MEDENMSDDVIKTVQQTVQASSAPKKPKRKVSKATMPYAAASSGMKAREEVKKILRRFGCESIGFMDIFEKHEVILAFTHRGRQIQLRASAKGWAQMWLKENPWSYRHRTKRFDYEQAALQQGYVAVNSILRDWIKGQVTAVECGVLSFEAVFLPFMLTADGRSVIERVAEMKLLPAPPEEKVVQLTKP
jgi:hypothetical protein